MNEEWNAERCLAVMYFNSDKNSICQDGLRLVSSLRLLF